MKTCANHDCGPGSLLPLGRSVLHMTDGGINEVIALVCGSCRTISFELALVSSATLQTQTIPTMERPEGRKP